MLPQVIIRPFSCTTSLLTAPFLRTFLPEKSRPETSAEKPSSSPWFPACSRRSGTGRSTSDCEANRIRRSAFRLADSDETIKVGKVSRQSGKVDPHRS